MLELEIWLGKVMKGKLDFWGTVSLRGPLSFVSMLLLDGLGDAFLLPWFSCQLPGTRGTVPWWGCREDRSPLELLLLRQQPLGASVSLFVEKGLTLFVTVASLGCQVTLQR